MPVHSGTLMYLTVKKRFKGSASLIVRVTMVPLNALTDQELYVNVYNFEKTKKNDIFNGGFSTNVYITTGVSFCLFLGVNYSAIH